MLIETIHYNEEGKSKNQLNVSLDYGKNYIPIPLQVVEDQQPKANENTTDLISNMFSSLKAFEGESINPFWDNEGNIYINVFGKIMITSNNGKNWSKVELPECDQQSLNVWNRITGAPLNIKFSETYEVYSTPCGLWYKKIKSNNWKLARLTGLDNVSDERYVILDDVIIAIGEGNQVYTLKLTDN